MKRNFILLIILLMIFSIAGLFTWMASWIKFSSPSESDKRVSVLKKNSEPKKNHVLSPSLPPPSPPKPPRPENESPRPPLPREVDWSVLSARLIEMEKQCTTLITTLIPQLPPLTESEKAEQSSPATWTEPSPLKKLPSPQVTWAQVGHQLIELEKQREHLTILFIDRGTHETSQP